MTGAIEDLLERAGVIRKPPSFALVRGFGMHPDTWPKMLMALGLVGYSERRPARLWGLPVFYRRDIKLGSIKSYYGSPGG